jgi:hypothetical protein
MKVADCDLDRTAVSKNVKPTMLKHNAEKSAYV